MKRAERIVTGAKAMLGAQVIRMASKGGVVVLLTRVFLDPGEYGLLFFALSVLGFGTLFANLGLAKSAARYIAEYRERDPDQIPHIITTTLKYNLATITLVGAVFLLADDLIARLLGEPRLAPFLVVGVGYVAMVSLRKFAEQLFQGFSRVTYNAGVSTILSVGVLVCVPGFLLLGAGTLGALYGYTLGYALAVIVGFGILYTKFYRQYDPAPIPEAGLSRRILEYSVPLAATRGANILDKRVDTILVGVFISPVAVGYYTLGKQISSFAIAPATSLGFSAAPTYGEHKAADDLDAAANLYETTFKYTLALYLPAAVGLLLVAEPLIRVVFGAEYLGAVPVLQMFSLYVLLQAVDKITNDGLDYLGKARARAYAKGATSVSNFLLNLVAIPLFGVVGAAGATVLTYSGLVAIELYIVHRQLPVSPGEMVRASVMTGVVAAGMGLVVMVFVPFIESFLTLFAVVSVGIGVWAVLSILSGVLNVRDIRATLI